MQKYGASDWTYLSLLVPINCLNVRAEVNLISKCMVVLEDGFVNLATDSKKVMI